MMSSHSDLEETITPVELLFAAPSTKTNSNGEQPGVANHDMKEGMGMTGTVITVSDIALNRALASRPSGWNPIHPKC